MDEQAPAPAPRTGVEAVDAVVASVEAVTDRPLAEHVAVFEDAHAGLRRALDAAHDDPA
jgi:hypothetical protein